MCRSRFVRLFIFTPLLACFSLDSHGQAVRQFTASSDRYLEELYSLFAETRHKEAKKIMEAFTPVWNSGSLSERQKQMVYVNSNAMLKRRLKAFPHFEFYVGAITGFVEGGQPEANFIQWHESMGKMLKGSVRRFNAYLRICSGLFQENILYRSANVKWVSSSSNYTFGFDSLPRITIPSTTLTCHAKGDSAVIYNTSGVYYPSTRTFYGKGGRVTWLRAGLPENDVYAELSGYALDVSGNDYVADSVLFYYRMVFPQALMGTLKDKILANVTIESATYPRFTSYSVDQQIQGLIRDADYHGGFSLQGARMIGSGTKEGDARLTFKLNGKPFLVLKSQSFVVRPERVVSDKASVTIYWKHDNGLDSIYHTDVECKYLTRQQTLTLLRNTQSNTNSPFYDSYHKVDMYVDAMIWKVGDPLFNMRMNSGGAESKMSFESDNYFREQRFRRIQGISSEHPLYRLKKYADESGSRVLWVSDLAKAWRISPSQVRGLLIDLANEGFLSYDSRDDKAVLKEKTYFYLEAYTGKADYDIINFVSLIDAQPNATINLLNFDITLRGVSYVLLSDTQDVYIVPGNQELVMHKNRDFTFDGRVHAGYLDFFGSEFTFDYEKFKIDLKGVDSLRLKVFADSIGLDGRPVRVPLRSVIEDLTGELLIEHPSNKSSYRYSPSFPVFNSTGDAYVFYEYGHIFDSIYKKDNFYFKLDPFSIDSLDNYDKGGLAFKGLFNSAGIFDPMRETLLIQPDYSLGFTRTTPTAGLSAYGAKGTYHEHLALSHDGLRGRGRIDYLSSTSRSEDIRFFPDSANYDADNFDMRREIIAGTGFPHVNALDVYINWRPPENRMYVFKKSRDMELYEGKALLDGDLVLASNGVTANRRITFANSELLSNEFYLKMDIFGADTADFNLGSDIAGTLALSTKNMNTKIDLEARVGEFRSNGQGSYVNFPVNQYICYIDRFKWFFDKKDIQFAASTGTSMEGAEFVSVHPAQDSLRFFAGEADYSLVDYNISARKVDEILVADASIVPDSGFVTIEKNAYMRTLQNATVTANTTTRYHAMVNASINVQGRYNYTGSGDYSYIDMADITHLIHLSHIGVDTSRQTIASGEIPDDLNFSLSPNVQYKGRVSLHAPSRFLLFEGLARLNHACTYIEKNWFSFSSEIDPSGVSIPVDDPVSDTRDKLSVSISMSADSLNTYATFFSEKRRKNDDDLMTAGGYLKYVPATKAYAVEGLPDEKTGYTSGNSLTLDDKACRVTGLGHVDFGGKFGQFKVNAIGAVDYDMLRDSTLFDLVLDLDFLFSDDALEAMTDQVLFNPSLSGTDQSRPAFKKAIYEILGKDKGDKHLSDIALFGSPKKLPGDLKHSIVLNQVNLYWDREEQAFKSYGKIGIGNFGKSVIDRTVNGYVQFQNKRSGDAFDLYFETDPSTWFYFNYQRGMLQAVSSEAKFNDAISNTKEEKRVADEKDGKSPFRYQLSTERKKNEFIRKFTASEE